MQPTVLISANSFWNIVNFRAGLIETLATNGYRVVIAAPGADRGWASQYGAEAIDISIDRSGLNPLRDAGLISRYFRLIRTSQARCHLGFTAKPNVYGSIAARLAGIVSIPNVSGLGTAFIRGGPLGRLVTFLYRIAFRNCPVVMFQNADDRDLFVAQRIVREEQARLLPGSGIDLAHFEPVPMPGYDWPRFLFIGRLLGDKGVREFVAAARLLKKDRPDWRFQLLGPLDEGNRTAIQPAEIQAWISEGLVEYLGHASDVRPHIAAATAVVLPSYREGLPRSLLEAAAMGRPLVATDVPGCRHVVKDGINGLLCAVRDPLALAATMFRLGTMNVVQLAEMGRQGRALVEREFCRELVAGAYLDVIAQLKSPAGVGDLS